MWSPHLPSVGNDSLQQVNIANLIPLDDVLELDGVENICEVLSGRLNGVLQVSKIRHPAGYQIFLETVPLTGPRLNRMVELQEFGERIEICREILLILKFYWLIGGDKPTFC